MSVDLLEAAAHFAAAPFDPARWDAGLDGLAKAGGGWAGQLVAISPSTGFPLDMISGVPREVLDGFESWGVDPANQPRLGIMQAPVMATVTNYDFLSEPQRDRSPFYRWLKTIDCSFACMSRIDAFDDVAVVAAGLRHEGAGHSDTADREAFAALLPHVRAAVRLQLRLEDQGVGIAMGLMETIGVAVVVCDGAGRIAAASPAAEARLTAGEALTVREGRLRCADAASDAALATAIARAAARAATLERPARSEVRFRDRARGEVLRAEVAPIPPELAAFRVRTSVMVLLHAETARDPPEARLMRQYGLTRTEAGVALALASGASPAEIAVQRGVRVSTLRTQISSLLAKTGARRQGELVALIARVLR